MIRRRKTTWRHPTLGKQPFLGEAVEVEAIDAPILREVVETRSPATWTSAH